ncbi:hypothetical protein WS58_25565 [Burkholderia pseudomultivorans]|nr:hypothetical protein WS55_07525 [Burkholderia pseudomultivorans]KVC31624.1 hypothetical protein WS56_16520 [Burkholderia pseudomultivorans]KVC36789.1 hypothetical protein WS58_25565 [Burkholderia pseudomultivorans]
MDRRGTEVTMSTTAFAAPGAASASGEVRTRFGMRATRIAAVVATVCALHATLFVLLAHQPTTLRRVSVQPRVMMATLIVPTTAAPAAAPDAMTASRTMQRAKPASGPVSAVASSTIRPHPVTRARSPARDAHGLAPSRPVAPDVREHAARNDAATDAPNAAAAVQPQPQSSSRPAPEPAPAPAAPRFVARPECALTQPDYPPQSLRAGEHGTVLVELETDAAGQVAAAHVAAGSGYARLDAAARDAVLASRCTPYRENGAPVPMRARVPIRFDLDD